MSRATTSASAAASGGSTSRNPSGKSAGCKVSFMGAGIPVLRGSGNVSSCKEGGGCVALKPQRARLEDVGDGADAFEDVVGERLVDLHQADGVAARRGAAQVEGRDVD